VWIYSAKYGKSAITFSANNSSCRFDCVCECFYWTKTNSILAKVQVWKRVSAVQESTDSEQLYCPNQNIPVICTRGTIPAICTRGSVEYIYERTEAVSLKRRRRRKDSIIERFVVRTSGNSSISFSRRWRLCSASCCCHPSWYRNVGLGILRYG
jgi:hypothetical protein